MNYSGEKKYLRSNFFFKFLNVSDKKVRLTLQIKSMLIPYKISV